MGGHVDVLQYYDPPLEKAAFLQGPISDDVWSDFIGVVRLCHSYRHWSLAASSHTRTRPTAPMYKESAYTKRKRQQEHRSEREGLENHKYRAAFLAASKLWDIATLVASRKDTADWHLSIGLMKAVGARHMMNNITGHERADFEVLAFNGFDASSEVSTDAESMASRWRTVAGRSQDAA